MPKQEPVCICRIASYLCALGTNLNSGCPYNSRHPSSQLHRHVQCGSPSPSRDNWTRSQRHREGNTPLPSSEQWNTIQWPRDGCKLKVPSCLQHLPSRSPGLAGDVAVHRLLLCSIWCPPLALCRTVRAWCQSSAATVQCSQVFSRGKRGKLLLALHFKYLWVFHLCEQVRTFAWPSLGYISHLQLFFLVYLISSFTTGLPFFFSFPLCVLV